jgi:transcriptional regulator with XRE-family HTH domain
MDSIHPLKIYREAKRLTQEDLAGLLGVARTTVARWETGSRVIDDDLLAKVSQVTGIPKPVLRPDLAKLLSGAARPRRIAARRAKGRRAA